MVSKDQSFKIIKATYGPADVTEKAKQLYNSGTLIIIANNDTFGDPAPGIQKWLEIQYEYDGESCSKRVPEWYTIALPDIGPLGFLKKDKLPIIFKATEEDILNADKAKEVAKKYI